MALQQTAQGEKRLHPRFAVVKGMEFVCTEKKISNADFEPVNISKGGVAFIGQKLFPKNFIFTAAISWNGQSVQMALQIKSVSPLTSSKGYKFGAKAIFESEEDEALFGQIVDRLEMQVKKESAAKKKVEFKAPTPPKPERPVEQKKPEPKNANNEDVFDMSEVVERMRMEQFNLMSSLRSLSEKDLGAEEIQSRLSTEVLRVGKVFDEYFKVMESILERCK